MTNELKKANDEEFKDELKAISEDDLENVSGGMAAKSRSELNNNNNKLPTN